jgi:hypothetical protein
VGPVLLLAQQTPLPDDPLGYGILGLVLVLLLTGWLHTRGDYDTQRQRADRLEQALEMQREATLAYAEAMREMRDLGRLLRRVLEALPGADDDTPPPTPHGRRPR